MSSSLAVSFVKQIKEQGLKVPKLEISSLGGLSFVSACDEIPQTIIVNEATAGVDYNPDVAITKALVEHFERRVFLEGVATGLPICARTHSDGVAAYPVSAKDARDKVRQNAYCEALERFVWAKWWDEPNIGHTSCNLEQSGLWSNAKIRMTLDAFQEILPIESFTLIEPSFEDSKYRVLIIFALVKGLGYISGGAAGLPESQDEIVVRALAELIRHGVALARFIETKQQPKTFYERRLLYFGMGEGNHRVQERLNSSSNGILQLPPLEFDDEIESDSTKNLIFAHRCLFVGQPPFVDGNLERLCL